jgi:mRNA interferase RelE/StbE
MLTLKLSKVSADFLKALPAKHQAQIAKKIQSLKEIPFPNDSKKLQGKGKDFYRIDSGEYRIIYHIQADTILFVVLIGKRNDSDVYKKFDRMM